MNPAIRLVYAVRIALAYPAWERAERSAHAERANASFPHAQVAKQTRALQRRIQEDAKKLRADELKATTVELAGLAPKLADAERLEELFSRHFKTELDEQYALKDRLYSELNELYAELGAVKAEIDHEHYVKNDAYSQLESAKGDVDQWYARSRSRIPLYGKAGQKIEKSAWFSQDFDDLERAKSDRDLAYSRVQDARRIIEEAKDRKSRIGASIGEKKSEIRQLRDRIGGIKEARSHCYYLKTRGVSLSSAQQELDALRAEKEALDAIADKIAKEQSAFERSEMRREKIAERQAALDEMRASHRAFLDSFDQSDARRERRAEHRRIWLESRGITP